MYLAAISCVLLLRSTARAFSFVPHKIATTKSFSVQRQTHASASLRVSQNEQEEEEWHPEDPASTTPQLLEAIWNLIAQGTSMVKGESMTVLFPKMQDQFTRNYLDRLMGHLDSCKDVCDNFGTRTVLVPHVQKQGQQIDGFTVKSYRNPDESDEYQFDYDPFWDSGEEINYDGIDDEFQDDNQVIPTQHAATTPDDDEEVVDVSKKWVNKLMSDMGICPFTSGPDLAGMPLGPVFYTVDRSTGMEDMYATYWSEVVRLEQSGEKELSTTLLITPEFCFDNVELFENFSITLTQPLEALGVENLVQLVFFHPHWTFRDGSARADNAAANYARRSPWPMINLLRTNQVRAAQRGIPTGLVYQQNEKTLENIGSTKLEHMLRERNWDSITEKVNRRDMEALRIAMDYRETGQVAEDDRSVVHDATPAANKVDEQQVAGADMVNVMLQALEKRCLGMKPLSGPETSAAIMASDFVLKELDDIMKRKTAAATGAETGLHERENEKDDYRVEQDEMAVLFGRGGIMDGDLNDEDETTLGMDHRSFY